MLGLCGLLSACASERVFELGLRDSESGASDASIPGSSTDSDEVDTGGRQDDSSQGQESSGQSDASDSQERPPAKKSPKKQLEDLLKAYCNAGSTSCFMMDELDNKLLVDRGDGDLPIDPQDSKIVEPNLQSYLFDRAIQVVQGKRPESIERFTMPKLGIIGFDVWVKPNSTSKITRWNAVALDGFLSLQTLSSDVVACKYNVSAAPYLPLIPKPEVLRAAVKFPKDRFVHVACAYDGNNVSLWIDGVEYKGPRHSRVLLPKSSKYLLNWDSALQIPYDGQLGPLRIWQDIPAMREQIRTLHQLLASLD